MSDRIISISAAPYDGFEFPAMLDSIASCGAQYVEPAFIVGYTEPFDESSFSLSKVPQYTTWLKQSGLIGLGPAFWLISGSRLGFVRRRL